MDILGWSVLYEDANMLGAGDANGASFWFAASAKPVSNDYDGPGVNHIGIAVETQQAVDQAAAYLQQRGVQALFETPRRRPEFSAGPDQTYYQVMFESPAASCSRWSILGLWAGKLVSCRFPRVILVLITHRSPRFSFVPGVVRSFGGKNDLKGLYS